MPIEVEFLPVGEKSCAGDAIVIRYGDETNYKLMLVDGGTAETGDQIVEHLKSQFGEAAQLEDVVLTHGDRDHASGLRVVLEKVKVRRLWMHVPWLLATEAREFFADKDRTDESLIRTIKGDYPILDEIFDLADAQGTEIYLPFAGEVIGPFTVLSPTRYAYLRLLPQFPHTPDPDEDRLKEIGWWIGKGPTGLIKAMTEAMLAKVSNWIPESWEVERLRDGGVTSASNESSVVMSANLDGHRILLTGDAGINALGWAADRADASGFTLKQFNCVQIPHHGSRRNVGPTILDRLIGPIQPNGTVNFSVFVSAPKDDERHPRRIVVNAFRRRGGRVMATQGVAKCYPGGFRTRPGYEPAVALDISPRVEGYD